VEIYKKAEELGIVERSKTLTVLVQALFAENVKSEMQSHLALLKKVCYIIGPIETYFRAIIRPTDDWRIGQTSKSSIGWF
jgi:translation initiation factor 2 beta subunit (eIF-2beta)/eIF-5